MQTASPDVSTQTSIHSNGFKRQRIPRTQWITDVRPALDRAELCPFSLDRRPVKIGIIGHSIHNKCRRVLYAWEQIKNPFAAILPVGSADFDAAAYGLLYLSDEHRRTGNEEQVSRIGRKTVCGHGVFNLGYQSAGAIIIRPSLPAPLVQSASSGLVSGFDYFPGMFHVGRGRVWTAPALTSGMPGYSPVLIIST